MAKKMATVATRSGKLRQILSDEIMSSSGEETYGKFRWRTNELSPTVLLEPSKLDSLSLSSQDIQLFANQSNNTSEYFSLSLTDGALKLPEFSQSDILVKPNGNNNWILLPYTDETWQRGTIPTTSTNQVDEPQDPESKFIKFLRFIGPISNR